MLRQDEHPGYGCSNRIPGFAGVVIGVEVVGAGVTTTGFGLTTGMTGCGLPLFRA